MELSVSATTRRPREGEIDGIAYHFITKRRFKQMVVDGGLLEWAQYTGTFYGTPREPVEQALSVGKSILLEIDLAGARQVRASFPEAVLVFIAPPSWDELERRLRARGSDTESQIEARLAQARLEVAAEGEFDRVVVNDYLTLAVDDLVDFLGLAE